MTTSLTVTELELQQKLIGRSLRLDALQPEGFTVEQLSESAQASLQTVHDYLEQHAEWFTKTNDGCSDIFKITEQGREYIIRQCVKTRDELNLAKGIPLPVITYDQVAKSLVLVDLTVDSLEDKNITPDEWRRKFRQALLELSVFRLELRTCRRKDLPFTEKLSEENARVRRRLIKVGQSRLRGAQAFPL